MGTKFLHSKEINAAKNEFNQVVKVDPLNQTVALSLFKCDIFSEAGNKSYDLNIMGMQLDKLLNEDPNDPTPNLFLGEFYF